MYENTCSHKEDAGMKERIIKLLEGITDERLLEKVYWYLEGLITGRWK